MNVPANPSKHKDAVIDDQDMFDDSSFLAKFEESSFREVAARQENKTLDKSDLNVSALCCDEEISGYDKLTGQTWIYPTNYPVRDYQFNIINASLAKNTLVSLPTGLGKTFIAAVIMYNFYRWYPLGKIVFTAPTRPLVAQQIDACYNIVAIPPDDTIEMTGHMQATTRKQHWKTKRVFFATPQVIYNDLKSGICPADKIRCLVFDEAHRARGNYAYCQIVATLTEMGHKTFRILALSATPGSKVDDVVNVVKNLHIAHLELRAENCIDVAPYSHTRKINTVVIQLGPELSQLRQNYVEILDGYARRLKQLNILPLNLGNLSKGRIVMLYKEYQTKERGARHPQHNWIMKDFTVLIALYHGLELLVKHGSRVFLNFFDEHPEKSWIQADDQLTALLERLRDDLGVNPLSLDRSILPDGTMPEIPKSLVFGHPKFDKLREIMLDHFSKAKQSGRDTKAIVFCEYRESVNLVHCLLLQNRPLIRAQMFVGQGASGKDGKTVVSQKQQLRVMRQFRDGGCNALVATCVAEEGLDVGSVDLIVCFDISNSSPVRLVQRCGRTGRERGGQVYILVTEGRENQTLMDCMRQRDGLNKKVMQSREVENSIYKQNPRMMPRDFTPRCQKMFLTVAKKLDPKDKGKESTGKAKKAQKDLRTMLLGRASTSTSSGSNSSAKEGENYILITKEEFDEEFPEGFGVASSVKRVKEYWTLSRESFLKQAHSDEQPTQHTAWLEWQRSMQKTVNVAHSRNSEILGELLQYADAKRFELPANTQNPEFNTQDIATQNIAMPTTAKPAKSLKKKTKAPLIKSPMKKDGDIRALFSTATKSTKNYTKFINDLAIPNDGSIPTSLINLLVDMSLENTTTTNRCYLCTHICDCKLLQTVKKKVNAPIKLHFLKEPKLPDLDLLDDITAESIASYTNKPAEETQDFYDDHIDISMDIRNNRSTNFELELEFESLDEVELVEPKADPPKEDLDKNFDLGDIEDIFAESSPEVQIENNIATTEEKKLENPKETLGFFGLDSIDDIFADSDNSVNNSPEKRPITKQSLIVTKTEETNEQPVKTNTISESKKNRIEVSHDKNVVINDTPLGVTNECPLSPSVLSGTLKRKVSTSPILCSQPRKFKLSTKKDKPDSFTPIQKLQTIPKESQNDDVVEIIEDNNNKVQSSSNVTNKTNVDRTTNSSMFTITQLVEMINKTDDQSKFSQTFTEQEHFLKKLHVDDERSTSPILQTQAERKKSSFNKTLQIRKNTSLIVLDSDSDSNDTIVYDLEDNKTDKSDQVKNDVAPSSVGGKRKLEPDGDCSNASPYFSKRAKLQLNNKKPVSFQEKVIAALSINKPVEKTNNDEEVNYMLPSAKFTSQKENLSPNDSFQSEDKFRGKLEFLQAFRRDPKTPFADKVQGNIVNTEKKRKLTFDDSDDDFLFTEDKSQAKKVNREKSIIVNHKSRKKSKKKNSFLDMEAELSDDSERDSGDELSDDSIGSIVDFICDDDNATAHDDMQAVYLKSVKSPVKGVFKIPQMPSKYKKEEIFSQYVEEDDAYEMDSFCVDSHIGLTQVNDDSELEMAEERLEKRRKARSKKVATDVSDCDSPDVKRAKNKNVRRISSDSDE